MSNQQSHSHSHDHSHSHSHGSFDWNHMYSGEASDCEPADTLMVQTIDGLPPGRALDIGCGAGGMLLALAERGWTVAGIDLASKGIAAARKALASRGLAATLEVADATTWRPTQAFDLITSSFALPGTPAERARVFAMAKQALAPGGIVLLKDFDSTMTKPAQFAHYQLMTTDELTSAFVGFEILRAEVVPTPPHDHDGSGRYAGEHWTAALLYARKPA
ncbi:MAG: hypothetical protein Tsb0020_44500 [Haliangiales bacterium]